MIGKITTKSLVFFVEPEAHSELIDKLIKIIPFNIICFSKVVRTDISYMYIKVGTDHRSTSNMLWYVMR